LVQADAIKQGLTLVVYDCYRPQRATRAFVEWAMDENDQIMKGRFYPSLDKRTLFSRGYIAWQSSHSTDLSVDLAIDGLDFGTPFDFFDPRSSTRSQLVTAEATTNRKKLLELMLHRGFSNYQREWWHFTYTEARDSEPWDMEVK
jgi:zinc D-Ala-D-Ala dipeptidase